jgi:hypothetical protein
LAPKVGVCWIVGPERDGTLKLFEQKLDARKKTFTYAKKNCQDLILEASENFTDKTLGADKAVWLLEVKLN